MFIIYGTAIPFDFVFDPDVIQSKLANISWTPFIDPIYGGLVSMPDIIQNVLFFLPFGFLGFLSFNKKERLFFNAIIVTCLGALLSAGVELTQLLMPDRIVSTTDIVTNTSGSFFGFWIANTLLIFFEKFISADFIRKNIHPPSFFLVLVFLILVSIGAWEPFDFSLDVGEIWGKTKSLMKNPFNFPATLNDQGVMFLRFAILAYLSSLWLKEIGCDKPIAKGIFISSLTGIMLEASQLFVSSRLPEMYDCIIVIEGSIAGGLFRKIPCQKVSSLYKCALIVGATFLTAGIQTLSPFEYSNDANAFNWVPFLPSYKYTSFVDLSNFIESGLMYFPLGFGLVYVISSSKRILFCIGIIVVVLSFSLEYCQRGIIGRYPDITDVIGAVFGAFAGAWTYSLGWPEFRAYLRGKE